MEKNNNHNSLQNLKDDLKIIKSFLDQNSLEEVITNCGEEIYQVFSKYFSDVVELSAINKNEKYLDENNESIESIDQNIEDLNKDYQNIYGVLADPNSEIDANLLNKKRDELRCLKQKKGELEEKREKLNTEIQQNKSDVVRELLSIFFINGSKKSSTKVNENAKETENGGKDNPGESNNKVGENLSGKEIFEKINNKISKNQQEGKFKGLFIHVINGGEITKNYIMNAICSLYKNDDRSKIKSYLEKNLIIQENSNIRFNEHGEFCIKIQIGEDSQEIQFKVTQNNKGEQTSTNNQQKIEEQQNPLPEKNQEKEKIMNQFDIKNFNKDGIIEAWFRIRQLVISMINKDDEENPSILHFPKKPDDERCDNYIKTNKELQIFKNLREQIKSYAEKNNLNLIVLSQEKFKGNNKKFNLEDTIKEIKKIENFWENEKGVQIKKISNLFKNLPGMTENIKQQLYEIDNIDFYKKIIKIYESKNISNKLQLIYDIIYSQNPIVTANIIKDKIECSKDDINYNAQGSFQANLADVNIKILLNNNK